MEKPYDLFQFCIWTGELTSETTPRVGIRKVSIKWPETAPKPLKTALLWFSGYSLIVDQQHGHKNQFVSEPEVLRQFRDHRWKALGKENSDLPCPFFCDHFSTSYFFKQVKIWPQQKWTRQIWIRLFGSQTNLRALANIMLTRTSNNLVRNTVFNFFENL